MFDLHNFKCQQLKTFAIPGGHIAICDVCSPILTSTYQAWFDLRKRITTARPGSRDYKSYVEKGIEFPKHWNESFFNFINDVGIRPSDKHILRRIDRWLGYSKENCRWYLKEGGLDLDLSVKWKKSEYRALDALKQRCLNPNHQSYKDYGGRGITVCDRWLGENGYRNFISDMGYKPSSDYSIERTDNNKGYSPENCTWSLRYDQARNRRSNQWVEYNGEKITLMDLHKKTGISRPALYRRFHEGKRGEALTAPTRTYNKIIS